MNNGRKKGRTHLSKNKTNKIQTSTKEMAKVRRDLYTDKFKNETTDGDSKIYKEEENKQIEKIKRNTNSNENR